MSQTFPTSIPTYPDTTGAEVLGSAGSGKGLSGILDDYGLDIIGAAGKIGSGASTPTASKVLRSASTGTSVWGAVVLTTDVTGTLPVANGGTGITSFATGVATFLGTPTSANLRAVLTDETGTGAAVFATSPTIVTPTIASLTNAQHTHANAAGGGLLNGANAITDGTLTPAELVSGTGSSWAWQSWTPTWTGLTIGTASLNFAKYIQIGKTVHFRVKITMTGAAITGEISLTPPVAFHADYAADTQDPLGTCTVLDTGVALYNGNCTWGGGGKITVRVYSAAGSFSSPVACSSTIPMSWGSGDVLDFSGSYEAA